ncbi:MAG UNVERIFIED_CONTAM: AAA family ATPase [Rickettsiaceae bacterium]|jgi:AAA+ ATPase superfamily predicted ATPase
MKEFIGRREELKKLNDLSNSGRATMSVIKGRRRIGKSRLIKEFAKDKVFLSFSGISPVENVNAQSQRDEFANQLVGNLKLSLLTFSDWSHAFTYLSDNLSKSHKTVILFDEISWMGDKDATFLPKLKIWWDLTLQEYPNVMLILCGSVSTWIEKNIIESTAFFGRISLHITLDELSISESYKFLKSSGYNGSDYDAFKILSIIGGVPWYLEQLNFADTIDNNIKNLCFEKDGLLVKEFDLIFNDLFSNRGTIYNKIIHFLGEGMHNLAQIREKLQYPDGGRLSAHLKALISSGFVTEHYSWSLKTEKTGRQSLYRLSDNYIRFYIKYVEPNLSKIKRNNYSKLTLEDLTGWQSIMGFQVESLLLKNRYLLIDSVGISPADVVADNPYIQKTTVRTKGCQIDYLIQTHSNNLFVCEFKFYRKEISGSVIQSMKDKIRRFSVPRGYGVCPVLFCFGEVSHRIHGEKYFYRIIDITDFFENNY